MNNVLLMQRRAGLGADFDWSFGLGPPPVMPPPSNTLSPEYLAWLRSQEDDIAIKPGHIKIFGQQISYGTLVAIGGIILLIQMKPFTREGKR